ncbi:hypothetical protein [Staphylococcus coagulans]|uniref:hypothetical protein n=1 Tax=Staphylococcus coagulans TaxID=74706 RepID=UPI001F4BE67F|nr:hypothetical protein [Staphylococcus coagulans]UNB46085.1 hypothetical protein KM141_11600 [Staphylococcus coagulans]
MDNQAIQHFSESLNELSYINWGSMISFIATLLVTVKKLLINNSSADVKIIKNVRLLLFPITLIILTTAISIVLNALVVSFLNEFSLKPYFYLFTNLVIFIIWFTIYFFLGFQSKLKNSLISYDMTEYQKTLTC